VIASPFVLQTFPAKIVGLFGQPLKIPCYSVGIPDPVSVWSHSASSTENELRNLSDTSFARQIESTPSNLKPVEMSVDSLSTKTTGFYKCTAENDHGKSELSVLVIGARPTEPNPEFLNDTIINGRAGDSVELGCDVIVDPVLTEAGPVRRFWEKDGKILVFLFFISSFHSMSLKVLTI
jgi:hypothetical protein